MNGKLAILPWETKRKKVFSDREEKVYYNKFVICFLLTADTVTW